MPETIKTNGVSYYGYDGYRYCGGTKRPFGPTFTSGDVIGTLLNMNNKTDTFQKNDVRIGIAIGVRGLTDDVHYPCISFYELGQEVTSC